MEQNRDQSLARVTIDSSLVYPTTSRRFIMALWEMEGLRVELLPRTIQEMFGFVQDSERRHWGARTRAEAERTGVSLPTQDSLLDREGDRTRRGRMGQQGARIRRHTRAKRLDAARRRADGRAGDAGKRPRRINPAKVLQGTEQGWSPGRPSDHRPGRRQRVQDPCERQSKQHPPHTDQRMAHRAKARPGRVRAGRRRRHRSGRLLARAAGAHARGSAARHAACPGRRARREKETSWRHSSNE